ncbi:hypothetical protein ACVXHA_15090 [Escherichia coli]
MNCHASRCGDYSIGFRSTRGYRTLESHGVTVDKWGRIIAMMWKASTVTRPPIKISPVATPWSVRIGGYSQCRTSCGTGYDSLG